MKETVYIDLGGNQEMPVEVEKLGSAARARFLAMYPGNGSVTMNSFDDEMVDWFVEVTEWATCYTEDELLSLSTYQMSMLVDAVVPVALDIDTTENQPTTVPSDDWMVISQ